MKKKILWIILLVVLVAAVVCGVVFSRKQEAKVASAGTKEGKSLESENVVENQEIEKTENEGKTDNNSKTAEKKEFKKVKLKDGTLYSLTGEEVKADVVLTDNYFDTTINDMWVNPDSYKGKIIEIEGMYLQNLPYTFVGRYSASNLCPNCPP